MDSNNLGNEYGGWICSGRRDDRVKGLMKQYNISGKNQNLRRAELE